MFEFLAEIFYQLFSLEIKDPTEITPPAERTADINNSKDPNISSDFFLSLPRSVDDALNKAIEQLSAKEKDYGSNRSRTCNSLH